MTFPTQADTVETFERSFADYVGAKYAIALVNGTATLHTALVALGLDPGAPVAVPPLTMAATTYAVLLAGYRPVFVDVDPKTWLMAPTWAQHGGLGEAWLPVSLYGLHYHHPAKAYARPMTPTVDDAAQTLRSHEAWCAFTSYSFQASKILSTGEGGMLVTNDAELAQRAREFSSLGYRLAPTQSRIDPAAIKAPSAIRHVADWPLAINYRMNAVTAELGWRRLRDADRLIAKRREAAAFYAAAIEGHEWLVPQHVPQYVPRGTSHDMWTFAVAAETPAQARAVADGIVKAGGERPYAAWRLTYREPAFADLAPLGTCPVAEDLQPRLLQFQTNDVKQAEANAQALRRAIVALETDLSPVTVSNYWRDLEPAL